MIDGGQCDAKTARWLTGLHERLRDSGCLSRSTLGAVRQRVQLEACFDVHPQRA